MKLTDEQAGVVTNNLGLSVISQDHDVQPQLEKALGEHTFFISDKGLFVFSPQSDADSEDEKARLFIVATWSSEEKNKLTPVNPPGAVDVVFDLADGSISSGG